MPPKRSHRRSCIALVLAFAGCTASDDIPAPAIANVLPAHATPGQIVVVAGSYFCQRPMTGSDQDPHCSTIGSVSFGMVPGTPTDWTDTAIMVEVPASPPGRADVQVTAAGRTTNSVAFTVD
jgi:hypothetical protein